MVLTASSLGIQGTMLLAEYGWHGDNPGLFLIDCETGSYEAISDEGIQYAQFSADGTEICGEQWGTFFVMKNDGTGRRDLFTEAEFQAATGYSRFNSGLTRDIAFADDGLYWIQTDEGYPFKKLFFADRYTGEISELMDLSEFGDGVQGIWMSRDGLRGLTWLHEATVAFSFTSPRTGGTARDMGIWGHGPVLTADGSKVIINAMTQDYDLGTGNPHHKTFVVYDFVTGSLGSFDDRFPSGNADFTTIMGATQVRNSDNHIAYVTETNNDAGPVTGWYVLNWTTHASEAIPSPWGGSDWHGEMKDVWLGTLPDPYAEHPAIGLNTTALEFLSASGDPAPQNVTVYNLGTGTLDDVTVALSPASASTWLTVTRTGSGNAQALANTITTAGLTNGVHTATVTVNAGNATNAPSYTVTLTLGSTLAAPSGLLHTVDYNGASINLRWTDNSDGEDGFIIQRNTDGAGFVEDGRVGAGVASYVSTGLGAGTHVFQVVAYDGSGQSAPSSTITETLTGNPRFALLAPATGDTLVAGATTAVRWTAEITSLVEVKISSDEGESWTTVNPQGGIGTADAEWGRFDITVPSTPTAGFMVMVHQYGESTIAVMSGPMTVVDGSGAVRGGAAHRYPSAVSLRLGPGATMRAMGPADAQVHVEVYSLDGDRLAVYRGVTNTELVADRGISWSPAVSSVVARYRMSGNASCSSVLQFHP